MERIQAKDNGISYDRFLHQFRYKIVKNNTVSFSSMPSILDCACGNGYGAEILKDIAFYTGVDISKEAISNAQKNYGEHGVFCICDGECLPFPDETFDVVSSLETIEHLPKEKHHNFVMELLRVLKPGGRFIITTPNKEYLHKRYIKSQGWSNPYHKYEYSLREFKKFIESIPIVTVCKVSVLGFPIPLPMRFLRLNRIRYSLAKKIANFWIFSGVLCKSLSNTIVLIAKKNI